MANPRLIKKRVVSIKNISKITKALEMVSASKVQKAQTAALNAKPYAKIIYELIGSLAGTTKLSEVPLLRIPSTFKTDLYIMISTNRGLAGSLNTNLFRFALNNLSSKIGVRHAFVSIGKKGRSFCVGNGELIADFSDEKDIGSKASAVTKLVAEGFLNETFDATYIVYSEFINALTQIPRVRQILPISKKLLEEELGRRHFELMGESDLENKSEVVNIAYSYEPNAVEVLENLLPLYIEIQIVEAIYEAEASEHSARMIAMKNATDNAKELSEVLSLVYNKARQNLVTNEISDITTAQISLGS